MGLASNIDLNGIMEQPQHHTGSFKLAPQVDIDIPSPVVQKEVKVPGIDIVELPIETYEDDFTIRRKR